MDEPVPDDPRLVLEDGLPGEPATGPALVRDDRSVGRHRPVVEQLGADYCSGSKIRRGQPREGSNPSPGTTSHAQIASGPSQPTWRPRQAELALGRHRDVELVGHGGDPAGIPVGTSPWSARSPCRHADASGPRVTAARHPVSPAALPDAASSHRLMGRPYQRVPQSRSASNLYPCTGAPKAQTLPHGAMLTASDERSDP